MPFKIVFMGTPDFSVKSLDALINAGHHICAVYSQPPRPSGRGHKVQLSPVHTRAQEMGLPVYTPLNFKEIEDQERFKAHQADLAVVVAYGLILRKVILEAPRLGCVNIHASLLPRWRGAAPIQRAILAGDTETGVTIMQMDEGLDTGPMLLKESIPIISTTTSPLLQDQLAALGAEMIVKAIDLLQHNQLTATPQPTDGVTYAHKLTRAEGWLNWHESATKLNQQIRALNPWPGTLLSYNHENIKVIAAEVLPQTTDQEPGTVLDDDLAIACGHTQVLRLLTLQRAGKAALSASEFLKGNPIPKGSRLTLPDLTYATL